MPVSEEQVWEALRDCYDPEIPLNIVDLGLIYEVKVENEAVHVKMTLTAQGCPAHGDIADGVRSRVQTIPGVKDAAVEIVWDPPWDPSRMSEEGKRRLGITA
ncbi:MAG: metal-sulfur cluster assembly factor [Acidobacteria bacterium]|nr:metal-sulfur cluster assembly factor [Acidobacteriota bacterium]